MILKETLRELIVLREHSADDGRDVSRTAANFQHRPDERFDHGSNRQWSIARLRFDGVQHHVATFIHGGEAARNHSAKQRLFGLEMIIDGGEIYFRFGRDGSKRRGFEALFGQQSFGRVQDAVLG